MNRVSESRILGMYSGAAIALGIDLDAVAELAALTRSDREALDVILWWKRGDGDRVREALRHLRALRVNEQLAAARSRAR